MAFAIASGLTPQAGIYCAVIIGFTNGIALVIASTQVRDFLGLTVDVPGEFIPRLRAITTSLGSVSPDSLALGGGTLLLLILWSRYVKRVPAYIVALFAGTGAAILLQLDVATIGSRFGGIPSGLPTFQIPVFRPELVLTLISPALTVAMLGAIESLLSAVVADRMGGDRHNPNTELFAQGVANIVSPMFGGLPATGALARTATNIRSGARSPMSGIIHALTLMAVLLFGASLAAYVPLPVLAAILFVVAWNMGEWLEIGEVFKQSYADIAVWIATFSLTVLADLTVAVEVGMVLAALLFIRRVAQTTTVSRVTREYIEAGRPHILQDKIIPDYVAIFRIHGPFLFGGTDKLREIADQADALPPVVVLRLRNMTAIDATGLSAIEELADELKAKGHTLVLCGAPSQPLVAMRKAEFHARLGDENICESVQSALDRAAAIVLGSGQENHTLG